MLTIATAYTAPINPTATSTTSEQEEGASSPTPLTQTLVFKGLQRKVRHAEEFVPAIISCEVLSVEGNVVKRKVVFKKGMGPSGDVVERCVEWAPTKVDFHQPNGTTISNIISQGPTLSPTDLYLTYSFEWKHPDIAPGSDEAAALMEKHKGMAKMAVDKTLEAIREFVRRGELKED